MFLSRVCTSTGEKWPRFGRHFLSSSLTQVTHPYNPRKYQLPLGYVTVPNFLEIYAEGVQEKVQHQDPATSLCTVMYTEVGKLNEVIEIWRHSCVGGMESSRFMAREAPKWREAIGKMAEIAIKFENEIVNPVSFSNWK